MPCQLIPSSQSVSRDGVRSIVIRSLSAT